MLGMIIGTLGTLYIGGAISRFYYDTELDQEYSSEPMTSILEGMGLLEDARIQNIIDALTWPISIYEVHKRRNTDS